MLLLWNMFIILALYPTSHWAIPSLMLVCMIFSRFHPSLEIRFGQQFLIPFFMKPSFIVWIQFDTFARYYSVLTETLYIPRWQALNLFHSNHRIPSSQSELMVAEERQLVKDLSCEKLDNDLNFQLGKGYSCQEHTNKCNDIWRGDGLG